MADEDMTMEATTATNPVEGGTNAEGVNDDTTVNNTNEEEDESPAFMDMKDAVEVQVDDQDVPMEEDDEIVAAAGTDDPMTTSTTTPDMSFAQLQSHTDPVYAVAASVDPTNGFIRVVSGGGDDKAFLHQISTTTSMDAMNTSTSSQALVYPHTDTVSCVALNMDCVSSDLTKTPPLVATGSYDGHIVLYSPENGKQVLHLEGPSDVEWLSFHPKGGTVLLAGSGDGTVWMFHIPLKKCLQVFVGHEQIVTAGAFSPDGKWALTASGDGTIRIWAPKTGRNKHVFRCGDGAPLTCMDTKGGKDHLLVIVGAEDGQAHVCHIGTQKIVASLRHYELPSQQQGEEEEMEYPTSVEAVGFCPSQSNWCATGGVDGTLKIWDLDRNGQCRHTCVVVPTTDDDSTKQDETQPTAAATPDSITRLTWHATLPVVFAATIGGNVRVWDARNGALLHTLSTGTGSVVNDLDIQYHGSSAIVVTASDDKTVRLFEVNVHALVTSSSN